MTESHSCCTSTMWFYYSISSQRCCIISSHGQQQYSGRLVLKWCLVGAMVVLLHIVYSTALVQGSSRFNMLCIQKCSSTPSMIVTSYCCLRISLKQSCRPSQTSDTNNTFLPTELLLVGHFPLFLIILFKHQWWLCVENPCSLWNTLTGLSGTNCHSTYKVT